MCGCFIGGYVAKSLIERKKLVTPQKSENKSVPLSDFHEDNLTNLCYKKITRAFNVIKLRKKHCSKVKEYDI